MNNKSKRLKRPLDALLNQIVHSWWVVMFLALVYALGLRSFQKKDSLMLCLKNQVSFLTDQKDNALRKKIDLEQQIASQKDPAFVEMILMKKLGVVPEGHVKICFKKSPQDILTFYEEL